MEKNKSLSKNGIFYLIYNILNVIFPFLTGVYVAHVLLPDKIGDVAYAQNIVQYFVIFAFLGIPTYGTREIAKARNDKEKLSRIFSELFIINLISTCFFLLLYLCMIFCVTKFREQLSLYAVVGIMLCLNALNISWLFEGLEEFGIISLRNLIFKVVAFVCLVYFVREPNDYIKYAFVTVIGTAGNYLFNVIYSRKLTRFVITKLEFKRHLKPIFMLVIVNLAIEIYTLVDTTMIGVFCDSNHVAFYSYASKINKIFIQVLNTFAIVVVPRLALYYKEDKKDDFNKVLSTTLKVLVMIALPIVVGIQFVATFVITKIYGSDYISSAETLKILSFVLLLSPLGYLLGSRVLLVTNHEKTMIFCVGIGAIINLIGNLILIPLFYEYGAAIASVISETVVMLCYIYCGHRYYKLNRMQGSVLKVIGASGTLFAFLLMIYMTDFSENTKFVIEVMGGIVIYLTSLILMKEKLVLDYAKGIIKTHRISKKGGS